MILWFLVAILILVPVHEFGHFYAMRRFGVRVLRFSVGFGNRLFTWHDRKGTEFAVSSIPLGGYVKPLDERAEEVPPELQHETLNAQPEWQRIIIFAAGPFANFALAIIFYWLIMMINGTVSYTPLIGHVEPGSLAAEAGLVEGQEIVSIDGAETSTRRDVMIHFLSRLGESGELRFEVKAPDSDITLERTVFLNDWLREDRNPEPLEGLGLRFYYPPIENKIATVEEGGPAFSAGFEVGDKLLSADGTSIDDWQGWVEYVRARPEQAIEVLVEREGGLTKVLTVTPERQLDADGEVFGRVGLGSQMSAMPEEMVRTYRYNPLNALSAGIAETWDTAGFILLSMQKLVFGEISTKNLSGPIGIAKVAASHAELGFWAFLSFLAHLSIVLGVLNLLPIPVLDGGHIVFALIEWVKGSPVSQEVQAMSINVGMVMLFGVMLVAFYNDILGF